MIQTSSKKLGNEVKKWTGQQNKFLSISEKKDLICLKYQERHVCRIWLCTIAYLTKKETEI